jgi:hypothetical protein
VWRFATRGNGFVLSDLSKKEGKFEDAQQPKRWAMLVYPYTGQSGYECMASTTLSDATRSLSGRTVPPLVRPNQNMRLKAAGFQDPWLVGLLVASARFSQAEAYRLERGRCRHRWPFASLEALA